MASMTLSDGRRLAYEQLGDPKGVPVIVLHGTPGSWRQLSSLGAPAGEQGVLLVAPDRPGYGGSSHDPDRTLASGAADLGELIAHLALEDCRMVGISGGGPTALACAARLADRVSAIATVGSPAPLVPRDPSLPRDRIFTWAAKRSELCVRALFAAMVTTARRRPDKAVESMTRHMSPPDGRLIRGDAELREALADDLRHASPSTAKAAARDFWIFAHRWDVELSEASVPVAVWHGTEDRNVPVAHAAVIVSRCPTAQLHVVEGGGHLLLDHMGEILSNLGVSHS